MVKRLLAKLSSKGQITVPREVRERLGVKPGERVEFVFEDDRTVVRPVRDGENPFAKYVGALGVFNSIEEINAWIRDMRDDGEDPADADRG